MNKMCSTDPIREKIRRRILPFDSVSKVNVMTMKEDYALSMTQANIPPQSSESGKPGW